LIVFTTFNPLFMPVNPTLMGSHFGEFAALLTAVFWTITALAFESASKKVGSLAVNIIRLSIAFIFLSIYTSFSRGLFFPSDASLYSWGWLALSGLVGFVIGDLCLFQAFVVIGARTSMLIMSLSPPIAALTGWIILGEKFTLQNTAGMALTLTGIALVVLNRTPKTGVSGKKGMRFNYPLAGLLLAFGGAAGQGVGLVLSKLGMQEYDAFASSQIRVLAGVAGFAIVFFILGRWSSVLDGIRHIPAMKRLTLGAFFGPFLGVSFSLLAIQHTNTGVASTIMSIVPVLIIAPSVIINKEKLTIREVMGAILAVAGVSLFFITI
jgi:drug/metabolite transporter (DMT)-like permease